MAEVTKDKDVKTETNNITGETEYSGATAEVNAIDGSTHYSPDSNSKRKLKKKRRKRRIIIISIIVILIIAIIGIWKWMADQMMEAVIHAALAPITWDEEKDNAKDIKQQELDWAANLPPELRNGVCPCNCISGGWDYSTGNLSNNNKYAETITLLNKLSEMTGAPPWFLFGINTVELGSNATTMKTLNSFQNKESGSIYQDLTVIDSTPSRIAEILANCFGGNMKSPPHGGNWSNGNAMMIGPYQIHSSYWTGYTKLLSNDIITQLGGTPDSTVQRGSTGHVLYFPDIAYGIMSNFPSIGGDFERTMVSLLGSKADVYNSLTTVQKQYALIYWYQMCYHHGNAGAKSTVENRGTAILEYFCLSAIGIDTKFNEMNNIYSATNYSQGSDAGKTYLESVVNLVDASKLSYFRDSYNQLTSSWWVVDWLYGAKVILQGQMNFQYAVQKAGGSYTPGMSFTNSDTNSNTNEYCVCPVDAGCCDCFRLGGNTVPLSGGSPGEPQASWLWSDKDSMLEQINKLTNATLKAQMKALAEMVGVSPVSNLPGSWAQDKFRQPDGIGYIQYLQMNMGSYGNEPWLNVGYNGTVPVWNTYTNSAGNPYKVLEATFGSSACGCYSTAMVLSTFFHKYINPAEVMIAFKTYNIRNGTSLTTTESGSSGAVHWPAIKGVLTEAGCNVYPTGVNYNVMDISSSTIDKVDACLEKGGMVIWVSDSTGGYFTSGGHYLVIREKSGNGYLTGNSTATASSSQTMRRPDNVVPASVIYACCKSAILVYPPGVTP